MASQVPAWLSTLLTAEFFDPCDNHAEKWRNERNRFCLSCGITICLHGQPLHPSHTLLQIRKNHDLYVVLISDARVAIDCGRIQTLTIQGEDAVYLRRVPPHHTAAKVSGRVCASATCERVLQQELSLYCSVECKLQHALKTGGELPVNPEFKILAGSDQLTPESVLEPAESASSSDPPAPIPRRRPRKQSTPRRSPIK